MPSDSHMQMLRYLIIAFVFSVVAIHEVQGGAVVSGTVICDQCKDGQMSIFDYPLSGMKVTMFCPGGGAQMTMVKEDTTNMLGGYAMQFDGTPDLSSCYTQISPSTSSSSSCGAASGPPKPVKLMFSMFDMSMYSVEPLLSQPAKPMSYCHTSSPPSSPVSLPPSSPVSLPPPSPVTLPPPVIFHPPPVDPVTPVTPSAPPTAPTTPAFKLPPMPPLPPLPPMPPAPFFQETACPYEDWMKPEYKCYWRAVNPRMPVALVFGPLAAEKYGNNMTLWKGLQGRGDPHMTLLREGVTALLNSYNSFHFSYDALEVLHHFNTALMGSTRNILMTALRFKRANSGHGHVSCKFTSCH